MRTIEWLLAIAVALTILTLLVSVERRRRWMHLLPWIAVGLLVAHLVVEGFRWQFEYLYAYTVVLFIFTFVNIRRLKVSVLRSPAKDRPAFRILGIVLGVAALVAVGYTSYQFPIFRLPIPSGTQQIGTRFLTLSDTTRADPYTADYKDYRTVSLQIWYPADPAPGTQPRPYLPVDAARYLAEDMDLPPYAFSHFALIATHAYQNAPPAVGGPFPVILYSASGLMSACQVLAEEMASRGYVFIAVGHPHWDSYYFAADGSALPGVQHDGYYRTLRDEWLSRSAMAVRDSIVRSISDADRLAALRELNDLLPRNIKDIRDWAKDISLVIDALGDLNVNNAAWKGKLDLSRIGMAGISKGGCNAGQVCLTDDRVRCAIDIDGYMYGDIVDTFLTTPFMFMHGEVAVPQAFVTQPFFDSSRARAYQVKIWGATHMDFGDVALYGHVFGREGRAGAIDPRRSLEIQNVYITAFFDRYLKGSTGSLLERRSAAYPEVEFNMHEPVGERAPPDSSQ